jgi:predicted N-acetyltransferase YhbS
MEIKELEESRVAEVVEFYGEVILTGEEKEEGKKKFEGEVKSALGKDHMLIALENGELIGFSWSRIYEDKGGKKVDKMIRLIVQPEKYGMGIGGALIEREMKYAREKEVDVFDIEVGRI